MPLPLIIFTAAAATTVFGAKKSYDGHKKHSEADDIVKAAKNRYDKKKAIFDERESESNTALDLLGKKELEIGRSIGEFKILAEKLINKLNTSLHKKLEINIPKHELAKIEGYSYTAIGVLGSIAGAGIAGAATGFAVYGGVMALGAASTGTAISSLSGAAATNAALAALGGGSLAAGGGGMALGSLVLNAAVAAPVLAVVGWAYHKHGVEALKNAHKANDEVNSAVDKMSRAIDQLSETTEYTRRIKRALTSIHDQFNQYFDSLKDIDNFLTSIKGRNIDEDAEISKLGDEILRIIENGYALASILVDLITTPIFKFKKINGKIVINKEGAPEMEKDADGSSVINAAELELGLNQAISKAGNF